MRKTLVIMSLALGTAAMAATVAPADGRHAVTAKRDYSARQTFVVEPSAVSKNEPVSQVDVDPEYEFETVVVGTSRFDYQSNGSYGKMIAVSADGVVHGVFMGGNNTTTARRVMGWCVNEDLSMPSAAVSLTSVKSGYISSGVTSANPSNGMEANVSVVGYHTAAASWTGADFGSCQNAFDPIGNGDANKLWPKIAVDYQDRTHVSFGDASTTETADYVYYNNTADGAAWGGELVTAITNSTTLSESVCAAKNAPGVCLIVQPNAPATPDIFMDPDSPGYAQRNHDICIYEARDANNDLHAQIAAGNLVNITRYSDPNSTAPFRHGVFAYADNDGIYDSQETPNLHLAWGTPLIYADTMMYKDMGNDTLWILPPYVHIDEWKASLWHHNVTTGEWGHIAGWLTQDEDVVEPDSTYIGVFRTGLDKVQLAHDPATGYLYALWNQYSWDDVRAPGTDRKRMANGELYAACSADNGVTWGEAVNLTNSHTPGCESPDCQSETFGSMAEVVDNGFLHITWMMDKHAGSFIRNTDANDGSLETVNNYYYGRIPVSAIPPHSGQAWDEAGHIGLTNYHSQRGWTYTNGTPDSMTYYNKTNILNEGRQPRYLTRLTFFHDALDEFGGDRNVAWEVKPGDPLLPGDFIMNPTTEQWDGMLPAQTATQVHLIVDYVDYPVREHAFRFEFSDGTVRNYRWDFYGPSGNGSLVELIDLANLDQYASQVLYENSSAVTPVTKPESFNLQQNVPNPFNPSTQITFNMTNAGPASLKVFNLQGAQVATLVDGPVAAGNHTVVFDGAEFSSGVYFYTLQAGGRSETRKMLLTK